MIICFPYKTDKTLNLGRQFEIVLFKYDLSVLFSIDKLPEKIEKYKNDNSQNGKLLKVFLLIDISNSDNFHEKLNRVSSPANGVEIIVIYLWDDFPININWKIFKQVIKKIEDIEWSDIKKNFLGSFIHSPLIVVDRIRSGVRLSDEDQLQILYNTITYFVNYNDKQRIGRNFSVRFIISHSFRMVLKSRGFISLEKLLKENQNDSKNKYKVQELDVNKYFEKNYSVQCNNSKPPEITFAMFNDDNFYKNKIDSITEQLYYQTRYNEYLNANLNLKYRGNADDTNEGFNNYLQSLYNSICIDGNIENIDKNIEYLFEKISKINTLKNLDRPERAFFSEKEIKLSFKKYIPPIQDISKKIKRVSRIKYRLKIAGISCIPTFILLLLLYLRIFSFGNAAFIAISAAMVLGFLFQMIVVKIFRKRYNFKKDKLIKIINDEITYKLNQWISWRKESYKKYLDYRNSNKVISIIKLLISKLRILRDTIINNISQLDQFYNINLNDTAGYSLNTETRFDIPYIKLSPYSKEKLYHKLYDGIDLSIDSQKNILKIQNNLKELIIDYHSHLENSCEDWNRIYKDNQVKIQDKLFFGEHAVTEEMCPLIKPSEVQFKIDKQFYISPQPLIYGINESEGIVSLEKQRSFYICFLEVNHNE